MQVEGAARVADVVVSALRWRLAYWSHLVVLRSFAKWRDAVDVVTDEMVQRLLARLRRLNHALPLCPPVAALHCRQGAWRFGRWGVGARGR